MILTYDAVDAGGQRRHDSIEAATQSEALDKLRQQGLYVTKIDESKASAKRSSRATAVVRPSSREPRLPLKVLTQVTRQLAMLLRAGSELVPGLQAIQRQLKNPNYKRQIGAIVNDLEEGAPLSEALLKHPRSFDAVYCAIVAAGEASGSLSPMFDRLTHVVGKRRAIQRKIIGALAYPALLIAMSTNISLVILLFVLPRFDAMFKQLHVDTPATTKMLLSVSALIQNHGVAILAGVILIVGSIVATLMRPAGRQWIIDVQIFIPVLGNLRSRLMQGAAFRTLGTLLESGVGLLEALALASETTKNATFRKLFAALEDSVVSGGGMAATFESSGLVDPAICQAIQTGEECGNLGIAFSFCADTFDETNEELITTVMRLVEPVILIGMGFVVGTVAVSLFMPLFDMTSAIK